MNNLKISDDTKLDSEPQTNFETDLSQIIDKLVDETTKNDDNDSGTVLSTSPQQTSYCSDAVGAENQSLNSLNSSGSSVSSTKRFANSVNFARKIGGASSPNVNIQNANWKHNAKINNVTAVAAAAAAAAMALTAANRVNNTNFNSAGDTGGGDAPFLNTDDSSQSLRPLMERYKKHFSEMRPYDECLNDFMRNISTLDTTPDISFTSAILERLRQQKMCNIYQVERYSRKVFVGGLPPDIDEDVIASSFCCFGPLAVDWPHKTESRSRYPPKGYAFLLFENESSVQLLIQNCLSDEGKLYMYVSSPTIKNKPVQIRPWRLADSDHVLDTTMWLDPRKTVFVGGVPRPLKAYELALIINRLFGGVCYASIDTDPELKYPKGAGRVAFSSQQSYITAISARFVQLQYGDIDKRVEIKPYVLDDQMCDECKGARCGGKFAPFFCANINCLQYYCEPCWVIMHTRAGREFHKPLIKEGSDRPRPVPFRWS